MVYFILLDLICDWRQIYYNKKFKLFLQIGDLILLLLALLSLISIRKGRNVYYFIFSSLFTSIAGLAFGSIQRQSYSYLFALSYDEVQQN